MRLAGPHFIMEHKRVELSFFWESHNLILTSPCDLWIIETRRDGVTTTLVMCVVSVGMSIPLCWTSMVFFPPQKRPFTTTALVTTHSYTQNVHARANTYTHILFPLAWIIFCFFFLLPFSSSSPSPNPTHFPLPTPYPHPIPYPPPPRHHYYQI